MQCNKDTEYKQDKGTETYRTAGEGCAWQRDPTLLKSSRSRENRECGWRAASEAGARQMWSGKEQRGNRAPPGHHCTWTSGSTPSERRSLQRILKRQVIRSGSYFKRVTQMTVLRITGRGQGQKPGGRSGGSLQESRVETTGARMGVVRVWIDI